MLAVALLAGCGGGGSSGSTQLSPEATLAAAKKHLDQTSGVHLTLSTSNLPNGVNGLIGADGIGTHAPAFEGTIKVSASGITANAAVVAVDGVTYAKLPFTTSFAKIDPGDYGAPDPAQLLSPQGGLSSLLTSATDVKEGKQQRDGATVLRTITGTVPGKAVATVIPSASPAGSFPATFTVTDHNVLTKAVLTGPFYPKASSVTYAIGLDQYGTEKHISKP